ncbi:NAD+ synthase, partial [Candidatus Woesearchaeota archaeon]|nr:NAD+ synthase [Candidatus Woesearchaeota archaeon]
GDVLKTGVYRLAQLINEKREVIPKSIIGRVPTAELKPGQKDSDTLPPYELLDPVLKSYLEDRKSEEEIVQMGYSLEMVKGVVKMVHANEFKRAQIPPCIKVSSMAFGKDWRMPICQKHPAP